MLVDRISRSLIGTCSWIGTDIDWYFSEEANNIELSLIVVMRIQHPQLERQNISGQCVML